MIALVFMLAILGVVSLRKDLKVDPLAVGVLVSASDLIIICH